MKRYIFDVNTNNGERYALTYSENILLEILENEEITDYTMEDWNGIEAFINNDIDVDDIEIDKDLNEKELTEIINELENEKEVLKSLNWYKEDNEIEYGIMSLELLTAKLLIVKADKMINEFNKVRA